MSGSALAGYFGKLPQRGDFVGRGLPRSFLDPWDGFLRELLAASREALGDSWLDSYLNGPIWRFALAPGIVGPDAAVGTLMPSVDGVGRYFPLTIAFLPPRAPGAVDLLEDSWFADAEDLSLDALSDAFDPDSLPTRLSALGRPRDPDGADALSGVLWWTEGARSVEPMALAAPFLPRGSAATVLIDGDWARWGWDAVARPLAPADTGAILQ